MHTVELCRETDHTVRRGSLLTGKKQLINNAVQVSHFWEPELANTSEEELPWKRNCQRTSKFFKLQYRHTPAFNFAAFFSSRSLAPPAGRRKHSNLFGFLPQCLGSPIRRSPSSVFINLISCSACSIYQRSPWPWDEAELCGKEGHVYGSSLAGESSWQPLRQVSFLLLGAFSLDSAPREQSYRLGERDQLEITAGLTFIHGCFLWLKKHTNRYFTCFVLFREKG